MSIKHEAKVIDRRIPCLTPYATSRLDVFETKLTTCCVQKHEQPRNCPTPFLILLQRIWPSLFQLSATITIDSS